MVRVGLVDCAASKKERKNKDEMAKNKNNATPLIRNKRALSTTRSRSVSSRVAVAWLGSQECPSWSRHVNLSHVYVRDGELFLCNASFTPADQVCTHEKTEITRTRKLLMHRREIDRWSVKLIVRATRWYRLTAFFQGTRQTGAGAWSRQARI